VGNRLGTGVTLGATDVGASVGAWVGDEPPYVGVNVGANVVLLMATVAEQDNVEKQPS